MTSKLWVCVYDLHWPKVHKATLRCLFDFLAKNKVDGLLLGGDQFDNECISHHTKGKPFYRPRAAYRRDESSFLSDFFLPLEKLIKGAERVWIVGNHDRFEFDLVEEQPELEGLVSRVDSLPLEQWQVVPLGSAYRLGKLNVIHGEILTGIGNQAGMYPSRKAVEIFGGNVLAGHTHAPQSYTKISPVSHVQKWMGWISPVLCSVNPSYLRNRPTAWLNGWTVVELWDAGNFNLYPVIVTNGMCSFGGRVYGGGR